MPTSTAADEGGTPMTRLLVVEPSYCPYQAGFSSAATAVSEVIEGESQILKPFGTPRIGLICSKAQSRLKYNRQVNDEGITVRGRFLICGLMVIKSWAYPKTKQTDTAVYFFYRKSKIWQAVNCPPQRYARRMNATGTNYLFGKGWKDNGRKDR